MKIHNIIAYSKDGNLGMAYNEAITMVGESDWVCFLDHDAMFTTTDWYSQLYEILEANPQYGLFACMTNRIFMYYQKFKEISEHNHDIKYHRNFGKHIQTQYRTNVMDITQQSSLSGVLMLISKKTWNTVGGFKDGFLGVDNDMHKKCTKNNINVGLMTGVYVYHWYRGDGDMTHVKIAETKVKNK